MPALGPTRPPDRRTLRSRRSNFKTASRCAVSSASFARCCSTTSGFLARETKPSLASLPRIDAELLVDVGGAAFLCRARPPASRSMSPQAAGGSRRLLVQHGHRTLAGTLRPLGDRDRRGIGRALMNASPGCRIDANGSAARMTGRDLGRRRHVPLGRGGLRIAADLLLPLRDDRLGLGVEPGLAGYPATAGDADAFGCAARAREGPASGATSFKRLPDRFGHEWDLIGWRRRQRPTSSAVGQHALRRQAGRGVAEPALGGTSTYQLAEVVPGEVAESPGCVCEGER